MDRKSLNVNNNNEQLTKTKNVANDLMEIDSDTIKNLIYTVRGKQVMLDSDLAKLYQVTTGRLNESVKRNIKRFPENFMFQLTESEYKSLISQFAISNNKTTRGGRRKLPYMFSESGIAMLSAVLRSDIAIEVSIKIMNAFVEMRRFLINNQEIFSRLSSLEIKQLETEQKFEKVFDYIAETKEVSQKVFFNGQIYDAYSLLASIIKKASKSIILIDNFVDTISLDILSKRRNNVEIHIYTSKKAKLTNTEIDKFNKQYGNLSRTYIETFHDRFMILDEKECYHIGTSIKDAGDKSFAITKIIDDETIKHILKRLK